MSQRHASSPLTRGDEREVEIEKLVYGGEGLGRIDGRAVFVPLSAPGDVLRVRLVHVAKNHARAEILEIVRPSAQRTPPACAHYGTCGGCQLQHVTRATELDAKVQFVRDALTRIGHLQLETPVRLHAGEALGTRLRADLRVVPTEGGPARVGYSKRASHDIVDVLECPILDPRGREALAHVRASAAALDPRTRHVRIAVGDERAIAIELDENEQPLASDGSRETIARAIGAFDYRFDAAGFFQANRDVVAELVERALADAHGAHALDLYCGAGLFTLPLARAFDTVIGVEEDERAVQLAHANAQANAVTNAMFECAPVEDALARIEAGTLRPDCILLDPPRSGASRATIEAIVRLAPASIRYVSCDPATLARDLALLASAGWRIDAIDAFDLFPRTFHVETVARLSRTT